MINANLIFAFAFLTSLSVAVVFSAFVYTFNTLNRVIADVCLIYAHFYFLMINFDNCQSLRSVARLSHRRLLFFFFKGSVWMDASTLSNIIFSHPENRNLHNTVFGGFIMRQATELSWALGYLFSKYRPVLKSISDISFNRPISVNSLIRMHAHVVFTQMQYYQVTVYVESLDSKSGVEATTNMFHFTYEVPQLVAEVFPSTYHEAMMYIDGRRHFLNVFNDLNKDVALAIDSKL